VLAFSHHKAGSTLLNGLLSQLSEAAGLKFVSIPGELFQRGMDIRGVEVDVDWNATGYCFGGFRFYPESPLPLIDSARAVLLVRDPRDALVSYYYSVRDSHVLPAPDTPVRRGMMARREQARASTVDEWVLANYGAMIDVLTGYVAQSFPMRANVAIYRYEDVIYRKRAWADDLLHWFAWDVPAKTVTRIVQRFDVFPDTEEPQSHIRQVHPGNHRVALKPETCEVLTQRLRHLLTLFGYNNARDA
jgi:hypothetical protein